MPLTSQLEVRKAQNRLWGQAHKQRRHQQACSPRGGRNPRASWGNLARGSGDQALAVPMRHDPQPAGADRLARRPTPAARWGRWAAGRPFLPWPARRTSFSQPGLRPPVVVDDDLWLVLIVGILVSHGRCPLCSCASRGESSHISRPAIRPWPAAAGFDAAGAAQRIPSASFVTGLATRWQALRHLAPMKWAP